MCAQDVDFNLEIILIKLRNGHVDLVEVGVNSRERIDGSYSLETQIL